MSSSKKFTCIRDFAAGVHLSEAYNSIHTPPPLKHCKCVYCTVYLFTQGMGGEMNQREGKRGNSSQSWIENTVMTHES